MARLYGGVGLTARSKTRNQARNRWEPQLTRIIPLGLLILGITGFGYFAWNSVEREQRLYPAQITIESRPGAAVVVPFKRRLERAQKNIPSAIEGSAITDPIQLPNGLVVIHSDIILLSSGASGDVVIWAPPEASGEIKFSITAWAEAGSVGAGATRLNSDSAAVTLNVAGEPVISAEPNIKGEWSDETHHWEFAGVGGKNLTIKDADQTATMGYNLYPGQNGRWFLAETTKTSPRVYWIEAEDDLLKIAWPGKEFKPFAQLQRGAD